MATAKLTVGQVQEMIQTALAAQATIHQKESESRDERGGSRQGLRRTVSY